MAPQLIFGSGVIGMDGMEFQDSESVTKLLLTLKELGIDRLDTAARYPPFNPGRSEQLLGAANALSDTFIIDTKVYTEVGDGSGDLTSAAIQKSVDGSLERLHRPQGVDVLFAHRPDPATPLEEQIQGFQNQIARGHARVWGVANHPPETLQKIIDLCEQKGWQKPSWYQGSYSLLTRGAETRVAAAMKRFVAGCEAQGLPPVEVASRWVAHHSALGEEDGIALGASKLAQVGETVANIRKGPLPAPVVTLAEELWDAVKPVRGSII